MAKVASVKSLERIANAAYLKPGASAEEIEARVGRLADFETREIARRIAGLASEWQVINPASRRAWEEALEHNMGDVVLCLLFVHICQIVPEKEKRGQVFGQFVRGMGIVTSKSEEVAKYGKC